jgi:hypothetical protein
VRLFIAALPSELFADSFPAERETWTNYVEKIQAKRVAERRTENAL